MKLLRSLLFVPWPSGWAASPVQGGSAPRPVFDQLGDLCVLKGMTVLPEAPSLLRFAARCDDTIKVAGLRVGPAEIEGALLKLPRIFERVAVGVPDPATWPAHGRDRGAT